ncbi:MAG: gliding motility-associated ABC transporter substrate-binding protein GldG [Flavobacteriales bacterium]|nr:gliding motility-associated ABC transporter substrate-binding protein GldG [Flavobacteriales bacterium]
MRALVLKEIRSFFSSLLGYTVVAVFLLFTSLFLWLFPGGWNILDGGMATLDPFFAMAPWVLMFLIPAITMRSFAEEHRAGTLELLLTRPLTEGQVVLAKFLGAWAVSIAALLPTLSFVLVVGMLGRPSWNLDLGAVWGSYLGLIVFSGALTGIGVVASSCTMQPLVAFLSAMLTSIVAYFGFGALADFAWLGSWEHAFVQLGMESHFDAMSHGRLDSRDVLYFVAWMALSVLVSRFVLALRRGRVLREGTALMLSTAVLGVVIVLSQLVHGAVDLTAEKRHTLAEGTVALLEGLQDDVLVTCYLTGELPQEWKRLESEVESLLQRMAQASGGRLAFQFVDIYDIDDAQTIGQNEQALFERGLEFTRIAFEDNGRQAFQTIWPGAMISFRGEESPVQFFGSEIPQADQAMIQGSINTLEFNLASGIRNSTAFESKSIAILEGHGELEDLAMIDLVSTLEEDHLVARVELDGRLNVLSEKLEGMRYRTNRYDLLIVAKPDSVFPEKDKVILDQFLMNGGRILWMVDPVLTDLDSLRQTKETFGVENQIGLYDQLFDYGVRLNRNLIIDPQCAPILLDAGPMGNQRNMQLFNWYFAPLSMPLGTGHPITNNLDPIHFDFVSSMDLVNTQEDVTSTMLLTSSERAKTYRVPVRISSGIVDLDPAYFAEGNTPNAGFAALLEGTFRSHYAQTLPSALRDDADFAFRASSAPTAMVVISDGDVARNRFRSDGRVLPLGYDRYARRVVYDNKEFLLNAINYLLQEDALISVRSRSIQLRSLDDARIRAERSGWQFVAVGMPLLVVMLLAGAVLTTRRRLFGRAA